ncbi:non-hydrolyzing UDP-N-acetylglucosamine 2-epimerase [Nocardia asiatica]|uniref:non-hydrolyzing UDP-N-acetylglucosamine 2-epimerase n=1 Tax=Nocardia asiatica TaxID=209252 RepID=UPI003EE0E90F
MKKLMLVVGTRPELVKLAPLAAEAAAGGVLEPVIVATGQQPEMVRAMAADFELDLHHELGTGPRSPSLSGFVSQVLAALPAVIAGERPDAVVVQGDTGSALAGALAGFYEQVPVVHLEAGLRTVDPSSPFPEEVNRRLISKLARLHLAPTRKCVDNLIREGIPGEDIELIGNTVIDALFRIRRTPVAYRNRRMAPWLDGADRTVLVTMHRRESWGVGSRHVALAIRNLARRPERLRFIVVLHPNPIARGPFEEELRDLPGVLLTEPLTYREMAHTLDRVDLVLTDSGGLQEEAPGLGTPVLILRDRTERTEAVDAGAAILVGCDRERIEREVRRLLVDDPVLYREMARPRQIFGDGLAALRAVRAIERLTRVSVEPVG